MTGSTQVRTRSRFGNPPLESQTLPGKLATASTRATASRAERVLLFLALLTLYSYFVQGSGDMQISRLDLTMAITREGRTTIDSYYDNQTQRAVREVDGQKQYYSDKAPGLSFLATPFFAVLDRLQGLQHLDYKDNIFLFYATYVLNSLTVVPATALLVVVTYLTALAMGAERRMSLLAALVLGFGTITFPYATEFFGHNPATLCGMSAFYLALRVRQRRDGGRRTEDGGLRIEDRGSRIEGFSILDPRSSILNLVFAGLLAGFSVILDYPNVIYVIALAAYVFFTVPETTLGSRLRNLLAFAAGGAPMALLLMLYNTINFGGPLRLSYYYQDSFYVELHQQGLVGVGADIVEKTPGWARALDLLFSPRGLFTLEPVLLLSLVGFYSLWKIKERRLEFWLCAGICATFFAANANYFGTWGGWSAGPRYLLAMLPFLCLPLAFLTRVWRWPLLILGTASVALMTLITIGSPKAPDGFWTDPVFQFWLPRLLNGTAAAWTMGQVRFGLHQRWSLLLLLLLIVLFAYLWLRLERDEQVNGGRTPRWMLWVTPVLVALYLAVGFPIDLRHPGRMPLWFANNRFPANMIGSAQRDELPPPLTATPTPLPHK